MKKLLFLWVLLAQSIVAADLNILSEETYFIDPSTGKLAKNCQMCTMDLQVCSEGAINPTLFFQYYNRSGTQVSHEGYLTNMELKTYEIINHQNGSIDSMWVMHTQQEIANKLTTQDSCHHVQVSFQLEPGASVDVVPVFNNHAYEEYAWFNSFEPGNGGLYLPFNENAATGTLHGVSLGGPAYNCSITGSATFSNDSSWGVFVNSSDTYPYGHNDLASDICTVSSTGTHLDFTTSTSWHLRAWLSLDSAGAEDRILYNTNGGSSGFLQIRTRPSPNDDNVCLQLRSDDASNEQVYCSTSDMDDGNAHFFYDIAYARISA